jgi:hypothetical protein
LKYLSDDSAVGFLGGIPQKGFWNQSAVNVRIPPDDPAVDEEISNFAWLHWEMSACFLNPGVVGDVRFDPAFDDFLGLCGDNDFLFSLARRGVPVRRWGGLRFYHCRGVTQARFGRKPFLVHDPVKEGALDYFGEKYNVKIDDIDAPMGLDEFMKRRRGKEGISS